MKPSAFVGYALLAGLAIAGPARAQDTARVRTVVLIMLDGLRWQEVFEGADSVLLHSEHGGIDDTAAIRSEFWRATAEKRRRALLPFIWDTIARHGQLLGNAAAGSVVRVTNGHNFSYPGYSEVLTGSGDPRINANSYPTNPNLTVFEWLSRRSALAGRVAAFGTWDAFPRIFNRERAGFYLWAGWEEPFRGTAPDLISTDHGRGDGVRAWRDHGADVSGADRIWIAAIGPDTPALGARRETDTLTQGQLAATVAALLGEDFRGASPTAAPAIADLIRAP